MTRETKIGLLVGLAFIIVIGILLSDHMTSTTQPPPAALAEAAPNVRESVTAPATNGAPVAQTATNPPAISPAQQVPTQQELRTPVLPPAGPAVTQVQIAGPTGQAPIAIRQTGPAVVPANQQQQTTSQVAVGPTVTPPIEAAPQDPTTALQQWAGQQSGARETATPTAGGAAPPTAPAEPAKREYVAQAGDSLSRMASKLLGSNSKANRDAIIRANPSLQRNPELVVEGRKYTIPAAARAQTSAQAPTQPVLVRSGASGLEAIPDTVPVAGPSGGAVPVTDLVDPLPRSPSAADGGEWYVVKDNDNLWKIAADQLGSGNAWTQIKELNKDVLKGGETVLPNMRLRLPAKRVASAN